MHQLMLFVPSAIRYHQAWVLAERNVQPFHSSHKAIGVEISNIVSIHVVVTNELNLRCQIMFQQIGNVWKYISKNIQLRRPMMIYSKI